MTEKEFNEMLQSIVFQREIERQEIKEKFYQKMQTHNRAISVLCMVGFENMLNIDIATEVNLEQAIIEEYRSNAIRIHFNSDFTEEEGIVRIIELRKSVINRVLTNRNEAYLRELEYIHSGYNNSEDQTENAILVPTVIRRCSTSLSLFIEINNILNSTSSSATGPIIINDEDISFNSSMPPFASTENNDYLLASWVNDIPFFNAIIGSSNGVL